MYDTIKGIEYFCKFAGDEEEVVKIVDGLPSDWHETRLAAACVLMACADDTISPTVFDGMKQEAAEDMYDEGPRPFGIVGGDVMELGKQVGGGIPF